MDGTQIGWELNTKVEDPAQNTSPTGKFSQNHREVRNMPLDTSSLLVSDVILSDLPTSQPPHKTTATKTFSKRARTHLAWLDGSRSTYKTERQPSMPLMPGTFHVDRATYKPALDEKHKGDITPQFEYDADYPPRGRSLKRSPSSSPSENFARRQSSPGKATRIAGSTKRLSQLPIRPERQPQSGPYNQVDAGKYPEQDTASVKRPSNQYNSQSQAKAISNLESLVHDTVDLATSTKDQLNERDLDNLLAEATAALKESTQIQRQQEAEIANIKRGPSASLPLRGGSSSSYSTECSTCSSRSSSECATFHTSPYRRPTILEARPSVSQPLRGIVTSDSVPARSFPDNYTKDKMTTGEADWAFEHSTNNLRRSGPSINYYNEPRRRSAPPEAVKDNNEDYASGNNGESRPKQVQIEIPSQFPSTTAQNAIFSRNVDGYHVASPQSASIDEPPFTQRAYGRSPTRGTGGTRATNWGRDKYDEKDFTRSSVGRQGGRRASDGKVYDAQHRRRPPVARNWSTSKKRFTAFMACINTMVIGLIIGIYAGEVPAIQYSLVDTHHIVILGNVVLYIGLAISTFFFWPLPVLYGRKPFTILAFALALPLQFPQAFIVGSQRDPSQPRWRAGLLASRAVTGLALGFAHINCKTTLLDLFGSSLQSSHPHGEVVIVDDVRRHGGGMGLWLGFWSWCFVGSLAIGFMVGAEIVSGINVAWGFYISVIVLAIALILNFVTPETRRASHRRTIQEVELPSTDVQTKVGNGEIKMHCFGDGSKHWWEECYAGIYLQLKMLDQPGFLVLAVYLGWIYGEIILIIVVLGNLLSTEYRWRPDSVGLGVLGVAVGAFLALPDTKANLFSKSRTKPQRTDSMTFQPRVSWTSHLVRRAAFMIVLPLVGIGYTFASEGRQVNYMLPIVLAAIIGHFSLLAIAECHGLVMETFDTCDLQPGTNSRHRLQSLPFSTKRKRTGYSCYPRVCAGLFVSQTFGFVFAAVATGVGGAITRAVGAQKATGITAAVLFFMTVLLTLVLWRFRSIQVIPDQLFGGISKERQESVATTDSSDWRAVIIGNPSGKMRRMSLLELGGLSRWTEVRRLNRLLNRSTTQALNKGWR